MPVTIEDTISAYRLLLGREPSSLEAAAWQHIQSIAELRRLFLASEEFEAQLRASNARVAPPQRRVPHDVLPIEIE